MPLAANEEGYKRLDKHITWPSTMNASLEEVDPEMADIVEHEKSRQWKVRAPKARARVASGRRTLYHHHERQQSHRSHFDAP